LYILVGYYDTEKKIPRVGDIEYIKFEIAYVWFKHSSVLH